MGGNGADAKITMYYLVASVVHSWLGMKSIVGLSWTLVLGAVVVSLIEHEAAMGVFGFLYIACGFLGLVLHSGKDPGHLMHDIKGEFKKQSAPHLDQVKYVVNAGVSAVGTAVKATVPISGVIKKD